MEDQGARWGLAAGHVRAVLEGLTEAIPYLAKAVERAWSESTRESGSAGSALEGIVLELILSTGRGDPAQTLAIVALPAADLKRAVVAGTARMGRAEMDRLERAAAEAGYTPGPDAVRRFVAAIGQVLAESAAIQGAILERALERAGSDLPRGPADVVMDRYELRQVVGRSPLGVVYAALDRHRGQEVALRFLSAAVTGCAPVLAALRREIARAATLDHPGILRVSELGEEGGRLFLAMELVEGATLRWVLAHGALPVARALAIARRVLDALAYAHARGVPHLDLRPANILLTAGDGVRVAHFGLARALGSGWPLAGGPAYAAGPYRAPEQRAAAAEADARADVFAAGVVIQEMLCGGPPAAAPGPLPESVPAGIRAALAAALAPDWEQRPPDAGALRARFGDDESPADTAAGPAPH